MKEKKGFAISTTWKLLIGVAVLGGLVLAALLFQYKWVSQNDRNGDGRIDEWLRFNLKGEKIEFRKDKNHDGKVDYIENYENDRLKSLIVDFDYDGYFEIKSFYDPATEVLLLLERDTNKDGKPDRRTYYDEKTGRPLRIEVDSDFDGTFDTVMDETKE